MRHSLRFFAAKLTSLREVLRDFFVLSLHKWCVQVAVISLGNLVIGLTSGAQSTIPNGNQLQSLEWFHDQGLGLFIHWAPDAQLGTIISHSLAGSSNTYADKYFSELPKTFDPTAFDPDALARLARVTGFRYMVFTTKHHNGFCMWNTVTTDFSIANTPYQKDITQQLFHSFRKENIAVGAYF